MMESLALAALKVLLVSAGIPLACASVAGLAVAIIQAATQLQEQCIGFTVRLAAVSAATFLSWRWIESSMPRLFELAFRTMMAVGAGR